VTLGRVTFALDAGSQYSQDFTPVFNWNTKLLYVSVLAEFNSTSRGESTTNNVVIWDDIFWKEDARIKMKKKPGKYRIHDLSDNLAYFLIDE
jgi:signal peptidase complex subunit 3